MHILSEEENNNVIYHNNRRNIFSAPNPNISHFLRAAIKLIEFSSNTDKFSSFERKFFTVYYRYFDWSQSTKNRHSFAPYPITTVAIYCFRPFNYFAREIRAFSGAAGKKEALTSKPFSSSRRYECLQGAIRVKWCNFKAKGFKMLKNWFLKWRSKLAIILEVGEFLIQCFHFAF